MDLMDSVFWTDSTSVLKYITNKTSGFKVFVANRVSQILKAAVGKSYKSNLLSYLLRLSLCKDSIT